MSDVTHLLEAAEAGDKKAAADLLPLVYDELRRLAAARIAREQPGHTLDGTALVHEAWLRLVGQTDRARWKGRSHFYAAAASAIHKILIDSARKRKAAKRGGEARRFDLAESDRIVLPDPDTLIAVDEALTTLDADDAASASIARLRLFTGLTVEEAADALGISRATAFRDWAYARAWLSSALKDG